MYRIECFRDRKGQFRWRVCSAVNGKILLSSEGYTRKSSMLATVKKFCLAFNTPNADRIFIKDLS